MITLGIRPESMKLTDNGTQGLGITVNLVEELGADAFVYGSLSNDGPDEKKFVVRFDGRVPPRIGDVLNVTPVAAEEHAFDIDSGERLG
jgi:multiple sugar transport system ATP-binding protein